MEDEKEREKNKRALKKWEESSESDEERRKRIVEEWEEEERVHGKEFHAGLAPPPAVLEKMRLEPGQLQGLIDKAAEGDWEARRALRNATGGQFEGKAMEDIPPAFRGVVGYRSPDAKLAKSLDELRHDREYSRTVVDEFVAKVLTPEWLSPAAAMMLYVFMLTKYHAAFQTFGGSTRAKLMQLYRFWDEAHPWVKANICYELRQGFYDKHHRDFSRDFFAKARRYDKIKEEEDERIAGEEDDVGDAEGRPSSHRSDRSAGGHEESGVSDVERQGSDHGEGA
jgi:hypothetical protein